MDLPIAFLLKKFLSSLLLPPALSWLFVAIGLLLLKNRPLLGRCFAWGGLLLGLGLSMPVLVKPMMAPLERFPVPDQQSLSSAQAIVILAGGARAYAPEFGGPTAGSVTLERVRYGARLAHQLKLPVLVSGGAPNKKGIAEAQTMMTTLKQDFGITPRWVEDLSLDTHQNAVLSQRMLSQAGIRRIVLVTHAAHMLRAVNEFQAAGMEVIPAPTAFFTAPAEKGDDIGLLPSANTAYIAWYALHEWLGLAAQRLRQAL